MQFFRLSPVVRTSIPALALAAALAACGDDDSTNVPALVNAFTNTPLVSDVTGFGAAALDPGLLNAWGLAFGPTGNLWVSSNGAGTSTIYTPTGVKINQTVGIPGGAPTGVVFNPTTDFGIGTTGAASFIFAGEGGIISAWNAANANAQVVVDRSGAGAVYKAVALASLGSQNRLYATDFRNNRVDIFDQNYNLLGFTTDPNVPAGYGPFGISNIGGQLWVTYAKQLGPDNEDDEAGAGNGFISVFNPDGTMAGRFASGGELNAPWGLAVVPNGFGGLGGLLLVGNFGDGRILVYDGNGNFVDALRDANGNVITIDGLWGITFGPNGGSNTLYYGAGPQDEVHGLIGTLTP